MSDELYSDIEWQEFEKTGSITAYLRYKGVYNTSTNQENNSVSHTEFRDGEPIGYC